MSILHPYSKPDAFGEPRPCWLRRSPVPLSPPAFQQALSHAGIFDASMIDGFLACPSLAEPRFMEAHYLASACGLLPGKDRNRGIRVRTVDVGGASPVSMILQAKRMVEAEGCAAVAVVAGDAVSSMSSKEFLNRADEAVAPMRASELPHTSDALELASPRIPSGYSHASLAHMSKYRLERRQLAMVPVLMSHQASRHPKAMSKERTCLSAVLGGREIASAITLSECARRADGAAAVIVASPAVHHAIQERYQQGVHVQGGGEAAGCAYVPKDLDAMLGCMQAFQPRTWIGLGFMTVIPFVLSGDAIIPIATTTTDPISLGALPHTALQDVFALHKGLEAAGLCDEGAGGAYVESLYNRSLSQDLSPDEFPINTHGGLLSFGAPWEVPALFSIVEACEQLTSNAGTRQVSGCRRAIVYGNGGIFGASAVAILGA